MYQAVQDSIDIGSFVENENMAVCMASLGRGKWLGHYEGLQSWWEATRMEDTDDSATLR